MELRDKNPDYTSIHTDYRSQSRIYTPPLTQDCISEGEFTPHHSHEIVEATRDYTPLLTRYIKGKRDYTPPLT